MKRQKVCPCGNGEGVIYQLVPIRSMSLKWDMSDGDTIFIANERDQQHVCCVCGDLNSMFWDVLVSCYKLYRIGMKR